MGRATLKDVAEAAGVHPSTASRALNPATRSVVSAKTAARVLAAAQRLEYQPHLLARSLRTNRTMTVGMVIPDVENPLFGPIIAGVEERLANDGFSLLITNTQQPSDEDVEAVVRTLIDRRVDGLIMATAHRQDPVIQELVDESVAVVLVNRTTEGIPVGAVLGDDHAGIGLAINHLVELGHRRIGHVAGPATLSTGFARRQSFVAWMQGAGLDPTAIEEADWYQVDPGYRAASSLLDRNPDLQAIVAANDLIALGCYRAAAERGRRVGESISITGYNDVPFMEFVQPALTSVRIPYRRLGVEAAGLLLSVLTGPTEDRRAVSLRLPPTLAVRASTSAPG